MGNDETYVCFYNPNVECKERNCEGCGWNPSVSEKRLDAFFKRAGIKKKDIRERPVNALDIKLRIKRNCIPLAEKGYSAFNVLVQVMKCIDSAETLTAKVVTYCKTCAYAEHDNPKEERAVFCCKNDKSPCGGRKVREKDFCAYGEQMRKEGQNEKDD